MSLCLSSQLQHHRGGRGSRGGGGGGGKFIIDSRSLSGGSVKIQEKSAWRMCIGSTGSLDTITLPTTALPRTHAAQHHHRKTAPHGPPGLQAGPGGRDAHSDLSALKNGVLQLPLCEKTISVNIQRGGGSRDGLLCTSAPASCCQVI
ncbi:SNF-related serine/threonine-protein kinase-like [Morone saxatilis]|uniref:SNF-related serine/threonine-protein kinase-like n=1 Tax=Morone saxatilis TaxID=34816 RepID=UPI0015E22DC4|nr:SNF-related serine/threonine-protein kinase-like [Morone saxatilis]